MHAFQPDLAALNSSTEPNISQRSWPKPLQSWWAVFLLGCAYLLAFVDRTVINLLVDPIQRDLGINDTQFGALQGVAFGLFYSLAAIPIGRMTDRYSRRGIVAGGLAAFTGFSIISGFVRTYSGLFLARIGLGAGEATVLPASYSMLSDLFPASRLGRAISIFTVGAFIGVGLSYIWGGTIIGWMGGAESITLPLLGERRSWQVAFMVVALPGILLVPMMFTLREPLRRETSGLKAAVLLSKREVLSEIWKRRKLIGLLFTGFGVIALSGQASAVWTIVVFLRSHGMSPQAIGPLYGMTYIAAAIPGAIIAGWLCDKLTAGGKLDAPVRLAAWGFLGTGIFGTLAPLVPDWRLALALFGGAIAFQSMMYPLAATAIQLMLPNRLRGQVSALYLVVLNVVGLGLGPMIIGLLTDYVFNEPSDLRYALAWVNGACAPIACVLLVLALGHYRAARAKLQTGNPG